MSTTNIKYTIFAGVVVALVAFGMTFAAAKPAQALTPAQICAVLDCSASQLAALQALDGTSTPNTSGFTFSGTLRAGMSGPGVSTLQAALNSVQDPDIVVDGKYGPGTAAAVKQFQAAHGLAMDGTVGPNTGAALHAATAGQVEAGDDDDDDDDNTLSGGAGAISDADFVTKLNNEKVGEDDEDIEVAGLEIEADEGSDIMITALTLDFDYADSGADDDLDEYAEEVSVWFEGDEVARVDAADFDDDNDYSRTISLDDGVIIEADETGEVVVALSGVSNLDSANAGEKWNVQFKGVRFEDADGAVITESSQGDIDNTSNNDTTTDSYEREFVFQTFAGAADTELKISEDDEEVNDAHVIDIDDTDDTDGEGTELLSFEIEVEGDSDILLEDLPVNLDSVGVDLEDALSAINLIMDGEEVGSENIANGAGTDETVTFDDIDLDLEAGETYKFLVSGDFKSIADGITDGDTVSAQISATERAAINAEDESGEDVATGDMTGTATGDAHGLFDNGIMVVFIGAESTKTSSDTSGIDESVEFTLEFDVTAFGDDIWVEKTCTDMATPGSHTTDVLVSLDGDTNGDNTSCTDIDSTGTEGTNGFEVRENQTERFTVTIQGLGGEASVGSSVAYTARLESIGYNVDTDAAGDTQYAFNLSDFKSSAVSVFNR